MSLSSFRVFSACFTGFLRVHTVRKILGIFEIFLGVFEKTKERKDREATLTFSGPALSSYRCKGACC